MENASIHRHLIASLPDLWVSELGAKNRLRHGEISQKEFAEISELCQLVEAAATLHPDAWPDMSDIDFEDVSKRPGLLADLKNRIQETGAEEDRMASAKDYFLLCVKSRAEAVLQDSERYSIDLGQPWIMADYIEPSLALRIGLMGSYESLLEYLKSMNLAGQTIADLMARVREGLEVAKQEDAIPLRLAVQISVAGMVSPAVVAPILPLATGMLQLETQSAEFLDAVDRFMEDREIELSQNGEAMLRGYAMAAAEWDQKAARIAFIKANGYDPEYLPGVDFGVSATAEAA